MNLRLMAGLAVITLLLTAGAARAELVIVDGTTGDDIIQADWVAGQLAVTVNGDTTNYDDATDLVIYAAGGNDQVQVDTPFGAEIRGEDGDDTIVARNGRPHFIDGGPGYDTVTLDSAGVQLDCECVNPYTPTVDNRPMQVNVLVMNFAPHVPSQGNQLLWQAFGWTDPQLLAAEYKATIERTSGGLVKMQIVDWMELETLVPRADGYVYGADEYYEIWSTTRNFHQPDYADNAQLMNDYGVAERVASGEIDEVWVFGPPGAGSDWEASMLGPRSFFINGGVYESVPSERPFALYGFNYERGVDCMTENTLHRMENHLARAYGGWNLAAPTTNWDRFTANIAQSPITPGVGSCHFAPNSESDYDWANPQYVISNADDWLNYPALTGATQLINYTAWTNGDTRDTFLGHHNWWLEHLPRAPGTNADGRLNNWWKYSYDYDNYLPDSGAPKPFRATAAADDLTSPAGGAYRFRVSYADPMAISFASLDDADLLVSGPRGYQQPAHIVSASRTIDSTFIVVTYEISAPGGTWDEADAGFYRISAAAGQVLDVAGQSLPAGTLGLFYVGSAPPDDLSENSAASWIAWAEESTAAVTDDSAERLVGSTSLKFVTVGGFDTMLRYEAPTLWDVTQARVLTLSLRSENLNDFQNASPWIRLISENGGYVQYQYYTNGYARELLNDCRGVWNSYRIPLDAATDQTDGWRRELVGEPDLTRITALEIHADTWDHGFTMWVDGLSLDSAAAASAVSVTPLLSRDWVYQNTPQTTGNRHLAYLSLAVSGTVSYSVTVTRDETSVGDVVIESTADPLVWIIRGSLRQAGGSIGTGLVKLNVTVTDSPSGSSGAAQVNVGSRQLGDIDGAGGVNGQDKLLVNKRLNGLVPAGPEFDLDGVGGANGQDKLILNKILNGILIP